MNTRMSVENEKYPFERDDYGSRGAPRKQVGDSRNDQREGWRPNVPKFVEPGKKKSVGREGIE